MSARRGDWRDLLGSYALALRANKVFTGFLPVLYTILLVAAASAAYTSIGDHTGIDTVRIPLAALGPGDGTPLLDVFMQGQGFALVLLTSLTLLNPFAAGFGHFVISMIVYVLLFWIWSGPGGRIARLTALEYSRDELPTLGDANTMVRGRRTTYFLTPMWPLVFFAGLVGLNFLGGLVASIPVIGRILLIAGYLPLLITSLLILLLSVFFVLSFGLMLPAVSVGGKDSLDSWTCAYTYVLWGFGRWFVYSAVAGIIGLVAFGVAQWLGEAFIYLLYKSVNLGFVSEMPWLEYSFGGQLAYVPWAHSGLGCVVSVIAVLICLGVRALPFAYLVSYFFTANTVIFLLLRKSVDNIEIDELYMPEDESEQPTLVPEEKMGEAEEETEPGANAEAVGEAEEETEPTPPPVSEETEPVPVEDEQDEDDGEDEQDA